MSPRVNRWSDLRPRMMSAAVMLSVGAVEIWFGGLSFLALITALTAVMIWERIEGLASSLAAANAGAKAPFRSDGPLVSGIALLPRRGEGSRTARTHSPFVPFSID